MATVPKKQAVEQLRQAVGVAGADDLVEIYNELFPEKPTNLSEVERNPSTFVKRILAHIDSGLEVQEILDLWNVIYPKHRRVWFDEDDGRMHYDEKVGPVEYAD